jgi:hypothetical protein
VVVDAGHVVVVVVVEEVTNRKAVSRGEYKNKRRL